MDQIDIQNKKCYNKGKSNIIIGAAVDTIIKEIGENVERPGLERTGIRVARALSEWMGGYGKDPKEVLNRTFPSEGYDDMAVLKDIWYDSHCEHHMTPFGEFAHIGIIYGEKITGIDKFVKLVDIFAKRLQTQEVMTQQIGEAIKDVLKPKGIMVVIEGKHHCIGSRETKNRSTIFITTYRNGLFKDDPQIESRFLQYIKKNGL